MHQVKKTAVIAALPLAIALIIIGASMRAPFTAMPPILEIIIDELNLSTLQAGILTSTPLIAFALLSPLSAKLGRKFGISRTVTYALGALLAGVALRSFGSTASLFLGTAIIGSAIAVCNVLLPSLIKQHFPHRLGFIMGGYFLCMGISAAIVSSLIVPFYDMNGSWKLALLSMAIFPALGLAGWLITGHSQPETPHIQTGHQKYNPWKTASAWQIAFYFGFNSTAFYIVVSWLPLILQDQGLSALESGSVHGVLQISSAVGAILLGPFIDKQAFRQPLAILMPAIGALGLLGLSFIPGWTSFFTFAFGLSSGSVLTLASSQFAKGTRTIQEAATLSGMSQTVSYSIAALGPTLIGALFYITKSTENGLCWAAGLTVISTLLGWAAFRATTNE